MVLCRNGRFFWNTEAGGVTRGVASGAANTAGQGVWSLRGSELDLSWDSGGRRMFRVEMKGNTLLLNGKRWLREGGNC